MNLNKIKRISIGSFLVLWTAMYTSCIYNNHQENKKEEAERALAIEEYQNKKQQDLVAKQKIISEINKKAQDDLLKKQKAISEMNKKTQETQKYFNSNKNEILSNINELIDNKNFASANNKIEDYSKSIKDPSLVNIKNKLDIRSKEEDLKKEISLNEKINITNDLIKLSDDKKYKDLLNLLISKNKLIERQELLDKIKNTNKSDINKNYELYSDLYTNHQPLTEKEITEFAGFMAEKTISDNRKSQFRSFDGSNILVVRIVKNLMHDPSSFEHINTTVYKTEDKAFLDIIMIYRGKNAFGAKVVNTVKARVSLVENKILSIDDE